MGGLINMIINMVMRHLLRRGVNAGLNHLSGRRTGRTGLQGDQPTRDIARKARQAANLARRLGR